MRRHPPQLWTIDELGAKTAEALAVDYEGPPNDRVRDVPDRRTIRYYTTLGLIDRAAEMRGRTAYYGFRHLLQLVAIKRLQASGLSLAEVQHRLLGLTDARLADVARIPAGMIDAGAGPEPSHAPAPPRSEDEATAFWKVEPAPPPQTSKRADEVNATAEAADAALTPHLQGIRLEADATLLIAASRPVDAEETEAIRKAAEPLLRLLAKRGLINPHSGKASKGRRDR